LFVVPRPLPAACAAEKNKYFQLYLNNFKSTLEAMYLQRVRNAGRSSAAAVGSQADACGAMQVFRATSKDG
jgi:hypothetical protein